jgi:hypothetical protein
MDEQPDFLDEIVAQRTAHSPEFPALVAQAELQRTRWRETGQLDEESSVREVSQRSGD